MLGKIRDAKKKYLSILRKNYIENMHLIFFHFFHSIFYEQMGEGQNFE